MNPPRTTPPPRPSVEVFIASSIDGFIARPDGALDWLMQAQATAPPGEDFGYADFMGGVDALVMGRKTFDTVLGFDPWPYGTRPVFVMSRQPALPIPDALASSVSHSPEPVSVLLQQLAERGVHRVYLDGGELIQACLSDDLVDRITVTLIPVLLGQVRSALEGARHWDCGFVQCRYVRRPAAA